MEKAHDEGIRFPLTERSLVGLENGTGRVVATAKPLQDAHKAVVAQSLELADVGAGRLRVGLLLDAVEQFVGRAQGRRSACSTATAVPGRTAS